MRYTIQLLCLLGLVVTGMACGGGAAAPAGTTPKQPTQVQPTHTVKLPSPTRPHQPIKTPELTKTQEATKLPEPTKTLVPPTVTPYPTNTPAPTDTPSQPTITPTETAAPQPQTQVVISELDYAGEPEILVVSNIGTAPQDMTGWKIQSHSDKSGCPVVPDQLFIFPPGYILAPGAQVRIYTGEGGINNPPTDIYWRTDRVWNNKGDRADLLNSIGEVVDVWSYKRCK